MRAVSLVCGDCGAPLSFEGGRIIAICRYCFTTSRLVDDPAPGHDRAAAVPEVAPDIGQQVVDLVLDGRRQEAIALFARHAGVDAGQAQLSVDEVLGPHLRRLTRQSPLTFIGLWRMGAVFVGIPAIVGGLGGWLVMAGHAWGWGLAVPGSAVAGLGIWVNVPHVISSWVAAFGSTGRARVVRVAVLRPNFSRGGTLVLVELDIVPDDGSPPFRDDETVLVPADSVAKLTPGRVLRVRWSRRWGRVFPLSAIDVAGQAPPG